MNTKVLEGAMSDTTSDKDRGQDTAQISEECLAQLKSWISRARAEGAAARDRYGRTPALRPETGRLRLAGNGNHRHRLSRSWGYFC
ncbi:MAG TPA: hypothetical protein VK638_05925 [Edaphobacter sp.]|nr:hypothetical protein [Edaphobacter sp.]